MFQVFCDMWTIHCGVICKYICLRSALTPECLHDVPICVLCLCVSTKASGDLSGEGAEVSG